jgi:hypothetical protein
MAYEIETKRMQKNIEKSIERAIQYADLFVSKNYLIDLGKSSVKKIEEKEKRFTYTSLIEISKICYDPQENVQDKLKTVYTSLANAGSSVLLLIKSSETGIRFFIGIRDKKQPILARGILEKSLKGNFPGIEQSVLYGDELEKIMTDSFPMEYDSKSIASVSIVPGKRSGEEGFVQGLEKFIDTMAGEKFTAFFIADPIEKEMLEIKKRGFERLYTSLSVFSNQSLAYGENSSQAVSENLSKGFSDAVNESVSDTVGVSKADSQTKSRGHNSGRGYDVFGMNINSGRNKGSAYTKTTGENEGHTSTKGNSHTNTETQAKGTTDTVGNSITMTTTQQNKIIQEIMKKIEEQLNRIRISESFGMFGAACYFSSSSKQTTLTAANTFKALMSGEQTSVENSFVNLWDDSRADWDKITSKACEYLRYGKHVEVEYQGILIDVDGEERLTEQIVTPANLVSGMELPLIFGLPMKSVNGVSIVTSAEFGRNVRYRLDTKKKGKMRTADMGAIYHMGFVWKRNRVKLDLDSLAGHCFITGTTGSGKSNTTYRLLEELIDEKIRFLVIEPAKGEYKTQFGRLENIYVFTTNRQYFEMLHLNPFEFPEGIHVAEHLQKLVQVFSACWPLYAAMPAILKEAFERSYTYCGWDIHHSIHFENGNGVYPTFCTVLKILPEIINSSAYSADSKGDYIGSLVTRVNSLTNGLVGDIFCSGKSIEDKILFEENTIIDLSRLQSDETVSLIMGVLIMKLNEYRMKQNLWKNSKLRHVTVLEEAHNILKQVSLEQNQETGNIQGASVGMIRKSIAEMRTYGEGFIIIDQSPAEVDVAAIRNTNTKFIMKLSDKDDFEMVGRTIGLNEEQILEIGRLPRGVSVTYQTEWEEPVLAMIEPCSDCYESNHLKENDLAAEKELLGKIISEMLEQHETGEFNLAWVNSIINKEKRISEMKKQIYRSLLVDFRHDMQRVTGKREDLRFAHLMYELAGCKDLFDIFPLELPRIAKFSDITDAMKSEVHFWLQQIKVNLDVYFKIEDFEKNILLEYLIVHHTILTDAYQYKIALSILYP